jgi:hypothetical protein
MAFIEGVRYATRFREVTAAAVALDPIPEREGLDGFIAKGVGVTHRNNPPISRPTANAAAPMATDSITQYFIWAFRQSANHFSHNKGLVVSLIPTPHNQGRNGHANAEATGKCPPGYSFPAYILTVVESSEP